MRYRAKSTVIIYIAALCRALIRMLQSAILRLSICHPRGWREGRATNLTSRHRRDPLCVPTGAGGDESRAPSDLSKIYVSRMNLVGAVFARANIRLFSLSCLAINFFFFSLVDRLRNQDCVMGCTGQGLFCVSIRA